MRYLIYVTLLLAGCAGTDVGESAAAVPVWGRFEHAFTADAAPDAAIIVRFTGPDGTTRDVDAFWDGDDTWRVRFMPDAEGAWSFEAADPAITDGAAGTFVAGPSEDAESPFLRHGALRVSADGTHFVHADGTPFFWLGDTAWNGALLADAPDWDTYLARRAEQGFTGIQFVTTQWRTALGDAEGRPAYTVTEGELTVNPAFFQRLDARVDAVNDAGLLAAPVVLWALGDPDAYPVPGKLPEEHAIELATYITARYGAHHVWWFLAGDDNFSGEREGYWRRVGGAVFGEGGGAPVTLHAQGMQWHVEPLRDEPWLDAIIYQSGHGDGDATLAWIHSGPPAEHWDEAPVKPVINSEPPYENHVAYQSRQPHTAYTVRRAVYWSLLNAPTAGVTYGGHGIWSWETEASVPLNHENSGIAQPWHVALAMEGSEDMAHVADLFTGLEWWRLRPAQDLLARQPGGNDPARFVSAARADGADLAVLYLPVGGTVELAEPVGTDAFWFDPRTGERPSAEAAAQTYTAPDAQDWVLVLH